MKTQQSMQQYVSVQQLLQDRFVRERIESRYGTLTAAERTIADHISLHYRELAYANASQIARQLRLSTSTLVRFAQKLGFDGYPALQVSLQEEFQVQHRLVGMAPAPGNFLPEYIKVEKSNISFLESQSENLSAAAKLLVTARHVWVSGDRFSAFASAIGRHLLRLIRPQVHTLGFLPGDSPDSLLDIEKEDVLWLISMSRYSHRSYQIARHLFGRIPIVLMTDEHPSPLHEYATVRLTFSTGSSTALRSGVGAIATVQALAMTVIQQTDNADKRLNRAEDLWKEFDIFYREEHL